MKKATILLPILLLSLLASNVQAQNETFEFTWFKANTTCPPVFDTITFPINQTLAALNDIALNSGLNCAASDIVRADGWSTNADVDVDNDPYISFGFSSISDFPIEFDGTADEILIKGIGRNDDGPTLGQLFYQIDGGPILPIGVPFTILTNTITIDEVMPALSLSTGQTIAFRFYAWNATSSTGTARLNSFGLLNGSPLPVELVSFNGLADGNAVLLQWETASETNNAGFFVEMAAVSPSGIAPVFEQQGFVDGAGTTEAAQTYTYRIPNLDPDTYLFRLKQVDYDGTFEYSPEIELDLEVPASHFLSPAYPNPFNPQAQFRLAVQQRQHVNIALYNVRGQLVKTLFDDVLDAHVTRTFTLDGSSLQSGLYVYRVTGERFVDSQRVMLIK